MTSKMSDRLVSVVIPTWNRCDRLHVALDAVCSQEVDALEVIVVDNNSRDNTAAVVKGYPDPRVTYTLCTKQGIYPALNHGFARTKGAYLTWTSDDNWYHPGALRDMVRELESTGADFVYSDFSGFDEETGRTLLKPAAEPADLDRFCGVGPCFLFRRRIYDLLGGHTLRYRWASDYDYWLRIYRAGFRMRRMPSPRYTFAYHETSASIRHGIAVEAEGCRVRLLHGCFLRLWGRGGNPEDSLPAAALMWSHGYCVDALSLGARVLCRRFWSPAFWGRCAGMARRLMWHTRPRV